MLGNLLPTSSYVIPKPTGGAGIGMTGIGPKQWDPSKLAGVPMLPDPAGGGGPPPGAPLLPSGTGPNKPAAAPHGGGFFGALSRWAHSPDFPMQLQAMLLAAQGNNAAAAEITSRMATIREHRAELAQTEAHRQSLENNLAKDPSLGGFGLSPGEAERAAADPTAFGTNFNQRYGSWNASPGEGRYIPNGGAPSTVIQAPTAAEQSARSLSLLPGTPAFDTFIRDMTLNAQGPTGTETARRGQDITERDSIRSNQTSRANNANTNATSRANNSATIGGENFRHTTPGARPPMLPTPNTVVGGIMARQAAGQPLNQQEQGLLQRYQAGRGRAAGRAGGGAPVPVPGRTATNPRGIRVQQYSDGSWRPAQ